jgi:polar amino acid transport system substrate-binding protein
MKEMIHTKPRRHFRPFAACLVVLCLLTPCVLQGSEPASGQAPVSEKPLRVGVTTDSPPLIAEQGGKVVGLEAELAREFGKFLGRSVSFVELPWKDQIPALLDNRTDIIMSGMSVTKARQYRIAFSEPYFRTGQIALIRKEAKAKVPMAGYYGLFAWMPVVRVGVIKGTTGEFFTKKNFDNAKEIVSFTTTEEAVKALKRKRIQGYKIDLIIHDAPMIHNMAAENEGELVPLPALLTEEYLAWGLRKDDVEILESANTFLENMKNEGKLLPIIKRWIPFI